jgi:hypothetical protein
LGIQGEVKYSGLGENESIHGYNHWLINFNSAAALIGKFSFSTHLIAAAQKEETGAYEKG